MRPPRIMVVKDQEEDTDNSCPVSLHVLPSPSTEGERRKERPRALALMTLYRKEIPGGEESVF